MLLDKLVNRKKKGFTLVELMVVVVIIGVLVAIAIPLFNAVQARAVRGAIEANLRTIDGAIMMRSTTEATGAATEANLSPDFLEEWPAGEGHTYDVNADEKAEVTIEDGVAGADNNGTFTLAALPWRQ